MSKKKVIKKEIQLTGKIIEKITGRKPILFRTPCWSWDINAEKVCDIAKSLGYYSVKWSISSIDWLGIGSVIKHKIFNKKIYPGEIFLFHDGAEMCPVSTRKATVELLPDVLRMLKRKQMSPIRLSDLYGHRKQNISEQGYSKHCYQLHEGYDV